MIAELGSWRGRKPSDREWDLLKSCKCPACRKHGVEGLKANLIYGFCNRATHNLWVLLEENRRVQRKIDTNTYAGWYESHLDNSTYLRLIQKLIRE